MTALQLAMLLDAAIVDMHPLQRNEDMVTFLRQGNRARDERSEDK
jgi:hypothetical protein